MPGRAPGLSARVWFTPRQLFLSLASPCTVAEQVSRSSSLHYVNQVVWVGCAPQLPVTCLSQHGLGSQPGQLGAAAFGERLSSESSASPREQFCWESLQDSKKSCSGKITQSLGLEKPSKIMKPKH